MQATHIRPSQRNYVVNRHVHTPCFGVDGIDDLPIRPSGSLLLASRLSEAISLPDLMAVPEIPLASMPLETIRMLQAGFALPDFLPFPVFGMAASFCIALPHQLLVPLPVSALGELLPQQKPLVSLGPLPGDILPHVVIAACHTRP
ncbi:MAG: hypothetical protein ACK53W_02965 [Gemmatimonadota bacterium]